MAGELFTSSLLSLCSFFLLVRTVAPSCSPSEPPILVEPTPDGSLEDALRCLDHLGNYTVQLYLLSGVHVISSGVAVSAASVALSSHPNNTDRPVVRCGDNMSHPGKSVNETEEVGFLTFWKGAREVSISGVDFEGCPRTVQFIKVDRVSIRNCTFRNFTQGPVNMYNCPVVTVSESTFENNHAQSVFTDLPSRVSGGGLSVTIYDRNDSSVMQGAFNYTIQSCTFSNNNANSTAPTAHTISILEGGHLNDRGGGVSFYMVRSSVIEIKVLGCNFTNNSASAFGGGLYVFTPELVTEEDFTITDNRFEGNTAMSGGGGVALGAVFQQNGKENLNKTVLKESVLFSRNMFVQNKVIGNGGAMFLGPGLTPESVSLNGTFEVSHNVFQENEAGDLGAAVVLPLQTAFTLRTQAVTVFQNNTFVANRCNKGGIIYTLFYPLHFQSTNSFVNNIGSCVQASEALVEVSGDMLWMGNSAPQFGAAVHLTSHAQLRLHPSANLTFVANSGSFASAIVADQLRPIPFLARVPGNPLCFLIYSNRSTLPQNQQVSLSFINNTAQVGSALYLQYIQQCSYFGSEESSHSLGEVFRSDQFYYSGNENIGHSSEARGNTSYDISTPVARIDLTNNTVFVYARENFSVGLRALDELGHPTAGTFSISQTDEHDLVLVPATRHLLPSDQEYMMRYIPLHKPNVNDSHKLVVRDFDASSSANLTLIHKSCPAGFETVPGLIQGRFVCRCAKGDLNIQRCNETTEDVLLKDWLWGTPITNSEGNKILFTTSCSRGYCHCQLWYTDGKAECRFTVSQDLVQRDQQCTCNRQGFLCGSCVSGTGVTSLLNRCEACDTANTTLIVFLVLVDAAFFLAILLYSLVRPIHLAAWWYPFLFYVQVLSYSTVKFPVTFDGFHNAMFYLGSLLGLYFPYDFCLYPNATAVEVYAIKYIPFIVALTVCTAFGVLTRYFARERQSFSGVWLIATLLMNPAFFISFAILRCPSVHREDDSWMSVWRYDGTVECYTEGHLPLAIWAGTVLAIYTLFSLLVPISIHVLLGVRPTLRLRRSAKLIAKAASYPYSEYYHWWYVVDFLKRIFVIRVAVLDQSIHTYEVVTLFAVYFLYVYARPYKATFVNIIELALLAYLGIFLIVADRLHGRTGGNIPLDATSIDSCGKAVPTINMVWIVLGVLYFLPVTILLLLVGWWLFQVGQKIWVRLRKWHAQLRLSRKNQPEPSSDSAGDFPATEVTLIANNPTNQIRFKSLLRRSMSPRGDKPDSDQGVQLMGVVKTEYNDFTGLLARPAHDTTSSPSDSNIHHDL